MSTSTTIEKNGFSKLSYNSAIPIVGLTTLNGTYTTPTDGFIFGQLVKNDDSALANYELSIGNKVIVRYKAGSGVISYTSFMIPVSAGATAGVTRCENMYYGDNSYYPYFMSI